MKLTLARLFGIGAITFLSGCSTVPETIRVEEGTNLANFVDVRAMPDNSKGETARWGGVIAKVENLAEYSMIEVVNMRLNSSARPKLENKTEGRFRVYADGLLDPVIYKEGKEVTIVGKVVGSELGKIGEHEYSYPRLDAEKIYLWKERKDPVELIHDPFWYTPSYWHFYSPRYHYRYPHLFPYGQNKKQPKVKNKQSSNKK